MTEADLVIVGGGPAGLAAAIHAAQRGLTSVVLERRALPLDKACGEGLMRGGVAALAAMGVEVPEKGRAAFLGVRYVDGPAIAEARFARRPGWGVRRTALVEGMAARARTLGIELRYECEAGPWRRSGTRGLMVETAWGPVGARLLVGADGLLSRVRREAGLELPWRGRRRFGVRRHFRLRPWSPFVEVHWAEGIEAYITPVGPDRVGVALLWDGSGGTFDELRPPCPTPVFMARGHLARRIFPRELLHHRSRRPQEDAFAALFHEDGLADSVTPQRRRRQAGRTVVPLRPTPRAASCASPSRRS